MTSKLPAEIPAQFNIAQHFLDAPARAHPHKIAILGEPREMSYADLAVLANRAGNVVRTAGCGPGDRVLIALPDSAEFIAAFFGVTKTGAIAVPVNPFVTAADFAYFLQNCGARLAFVHRSYRNEFAAAVDQSSLEYVILVGRKGAGPERTASRVKWLEWVSAIDEASPELAAQPTNSSDPAFFLYTSGSGGRPKAAIHEHKDMWVTSRGFAQGVLGLRPDDRTFSVSKLFFAYGLGNAMYFPFSVGASTILHAEKPRVERIVEVVGLYKPTVLFAVPTFYAALLREADRGLKIEFSTVRLAVSAGEVLPAEIFERFRRAFGLDILDGIGSTEMLHMFIANRPGEARAGTCGRETPGYEARIVDDAGAPVPDGAIGNLHVRGASAMAGYWQIPELTARTKLGDWVVTGDKFTRDADGYYHYCGRADDMMKIAGMWVSPGEVENALLGHPKVAEVAVVGTNNAAGLMRAVAYVVLRAGASGNEDLARVLREHVWGRLDHYKCPDEIRFCAELPKTATGKIQRFRLREASRG